MVAVIIMPEARKQLMRLPMWVQMDLRKVMLELAKWPQVSGAKPLRGELKGCFRKRYRDYCIVFTVQDDVLRVVKIGDRKDVYED